MYFNEFYILCTQVRIQHYLFILNCRKYIKISLNFFIFVFFDVIKRLHLNNLKK